MSPRFDVVLVRPKEDGNVGAVARLARNFGADRLVIVDPRAPISTEARRRAMGGIPILQRAVRAASFEEGIADADLVVGTTDLSTGRSTAFLRRSVSPERLAESVRWVDGRVALLFGPEDNGLSRTELARCDLLVHIPARREFPTLNLSHAVAVVLYVLHRSRAVAADPESTPAPEPLTLRGREKEIYIDRLAGLLRVTGYPPHKQRGLILLVRRMMGRSTPTDSEYRMMLGFLRQVERTLGQRSDGRKQGLAQSARHRPGTVRRLPRRLPRHPRLRRGTRRTDRADGELAQGPARAAEPRRARERR
ncbi:MAG: RNA methyltransferase [Thermoplasmata archaeon]